MTKVLFFTVFLLFAGCSFNAPKNSWIYQVSNSYELYKKNLLKGNDELAKENLKNAVKEAKSSADLSSLAKIYLGECALNNALGIEDKCRKYLDLKDVADSKELQNYYYLVTKDIKKTDPSLLPVKYKYLVKYIKKGDYRSANKAVSEIQTPSSRLIAIYILGDNAYKTTIKSSIKFFSYYGYKKAVLHLLKKYYIIETDKTEKAKIKKIIKVMESQDETM